MNGGKESGWDHRAIYKFTDMGALDESGVIQEGKGHPPEGGDIMDGLSDYMLSIRSCGWALDIQVQQCLRRGSKADSLCVKCAICQLQGKIRMLFTSQGLRRSRVVLRTFERS